MSSTTPQTIGVIIADDESLGRDVVRHMLAPHSDLEILAECKNGKEALDAIEKTNPDVIFLDIKMPGMDGMQLAQTLDGKSQAIIVFITAYNQYAIEAFRQNAIDYLLKPFDQERFDHMIGRVRKRCTQRSDAVFAQQLKQFLQEHPLQNSNGNAAADTTGENGPELQSPTERIVIKERGRVFFVGSRDVDYFEASGNYVALHVGSKTHLIYDTLAKMEKKLDPATFMRIHRSTIVNIDRIKELQPHFNGEYVVILTDGTRLKLSRSYKDQARQLMGLE